MCNFSVWFREGKKEWFFLLAHVPKNPSEIGKCSFGGGGALQSTTSFVRIQMITCSTIISMSDTRYTPLSMCGLYRTICYLIRFKSFKIFKSRPLSLNSISVDNLLTPLIATHHPLMALHDFTQTFLKFRLTSLILLHIKVHVCMQWWYMKVWIFLTRREAG